MPSHCFPPRLSATSPVRRPPRFFLTSLAGAVSAWAMLAYAQAATATSHSSTAHHRASKTAPARTVQPHSAPRRATGPMLAHGEEEISVASRRQALNGGGGMMRQETAPHAVQTVTKAYIAMRSPTSTALDLVKNLPT